MFGPIYHILNVLICLPLTVLVTCSHYRPPFQSTQTSGSTSWATLAGRLDSRSIVMVSWLTEIYWGRTEITWNLTIPKISLWAVVSIKEHTQGFSWLPSPLLREHCLRKLFPTSTVTSGDKVGRVRIAYLLCDMETTYFLHLTFCFAYSTLCCHTRASVFITRCFAYSTLCCYIRESVFITRKLNSWLPKQSNSSLY